MKTSTSFILFSCTVFALHAQQVPNSGFESWTNMGTYDDPTGWITSNDNSANITHVVQSSSAHTGNLGMRINTLTIQSFTIGGIAACPDVGQFFPVTITPDAISGWYIANFMSGDQLKVVCVMNQGSTGVGGVTQYINTNTSVYQQFIFPLTYSQSATPDSAALAFSEVNATGGPTGLNPNTYVILDDVDLILTSGIADRQLKTGIHKLYPNPGNSTSWIEYSIADASNVVLSVYDINGQLVQVLVNQEQTPGNYRVAVNTFLLAHGLYTVQLNANDSVSTMKLGITE
jgi:hypothetical protein